MSWTDLTQIAMAILLLLNFIWTIVWSIAVRRQVMSAKHDKTISDHDNRLIRLEATVERMPVQVASHADVEKVHTRVGTMRDQLTAIGNQVEKMSGVLSGMRQTVTTLADIKMHEGDSRGGGKRTTER